jgi:hypothetical protein
MHIEINEGVMLCGIIAIATCFVVYAGVAAWLDTRS